MTTQLTIKQGSQEIGLSFNEEKIKLIKSTIAKDATDLELQFFIEQCKRTGLDPITRQIYFIKDKQGKVNVQTSIDGLRLIAERSDAYQGQTAPQWCGQDGVWKDVWLSKTPPAACKVGVYKKNFKDALYAVAVFDEYAQKTKDYKTGEEKLNYIWGSKPALMLAKVAEALALRKAFPNDMSGIYTQDEFTPEVAEEKKLTSVTVIDVQNKKEETNEKTTKYSEQAFGSNKRFGDDFNEFVQQSTTNSDQNGAIETSGVSVDSTSETYYDKNYVIRIGKNRDKTLEQAGYENVKKSYDYLKKEEDSGKPVEGYAKEFLNKAKPYLDQFTNSQQ